VSDPDRQTLEQRTALPDQLGGGDEPEFPDYDVVTSDELDEEAELERARAQAVVDEDAQRAWELMTPDEREAAFRRAMRHAAGGRPVIFKPRDRTSATFRSGTGLKARRARGKTAKAARKRNRR
jgi:hypothetical protein